MAPTLAPEAPASQSNDSRHPGKSFNITTMRTLILEVNLKRTCLILVTKVIFKMILKPVEGARYAVMTI